jgi:CubicO group peptidase (beta-lactamase class C family)
MTAVHFSPALLGKIDAGARRKLFESLRAEFGDVKVGRVTREGPGAPLQLEVTGSNGQRGVIELVLEAEKPFLIAGIGVDVGGAAGRGSSGLPPPPINGSMTDAELSQALDAYLSGLAKDDVLSGVALVAKNGAAVFEKAYGLADRANRVPNTPATRFNLGSINKIFTQTAIEQLVAAGRLRRTDTVGALLPDYPQAVTRAATVDQLLNHSAGIADFFGEEFERLSKDTFRSNADYYRFVSSRPPVFAPGARSQYCNGCYIVLGEIIAKVSGMSYESYIVQNVFEPAGMSGAGAIQADGVEPHVAQGYTRRGGGGELRSNVYMHGAAGSAAGGGYARAADLLAFDAAMKAGKLLAADRVKVFYAGRGIAGGAPGTSAVLESGERWTIIVLTNFDPNTGEAVGAAISRALNR